jgi:hypothetical protein
MIELGVREFRKRFSELVNGKDFIVVSNNGKEIGTYRPTGWKPDIAKIRTAGEAIAAAQQQLRDRGVDLDAEMAALGMNPWGEPLDDA